MQTLIQRLKLYLLRRDIVKWDAHLEHLRLVQADIIRSRFVIESEQLNRRAAASLLQQSLGAKNV